jgi:hypothetical protein
MSQTPHDDDIPLDSLPAQPKRRRWLTVLLAGAIFCTGMIVGAAATVTIAVRRLEHAIHHPEVMPDRLAGRLRTVLDLSPDQTEQVRSVLTQRQQALLAIRRDAYPRVAHELELTRTQISEVLDDNQRVVWNNWFTRVRQRFLPPPPPAKAS